MAFAGMSGLPGLGGDPQGGQMGGVTTQNVAEPSAENPSQVQPVDSYFTTGNVSIDDQKMIKEIITEYRSDWRQDRLERGRQWMQNLFYWKGIQCIRWDTSNNCWYDALAWARSDGDNGEDTDLERWINPLVLMFCNVFTATMSRAIPEPVVKPENASPDLQDTVTAKAADKAIRIIGRQNKKRQMIRSIYENLFLFGCYFRYTRPVIDGEFGYDEIPQFEDLQIQTGPHFTCPNCGTDSPATSPEGMACPSCGSWMGQESYYAAGEGNRASMKMSGVQRVPRAGVKQSIHTPLEIDVDPKSKGKEPLKQTPLLAWDREIDIGEARTIFPNMKEQIVAGADTPTNPNAPIDRLNRLNAVSAMNGVTADNGMQNPTYSEVWLKPTAYNKKSGAEAEAFAARMTKQFPDGLKISMVGEVVVDIRAACLVKEWSHAALYENQGVYCAALANTAVSFNARFNRTMWILDDWASRAAAGLNLVDGSRIDSEKLSGKSFSPTTLTNVPMKINGEYRPMAESVLHFDMPINPALWNYPMMLMTFCELIIGIPRQLSGQGTQDDVETLGGQQLQLGRAATTLKPYFENVQDEDATASQNAFYCVQNLMKSGSLKELREVVEAQGGAFQNDEVNWSEMQGNVRFEADEDQDLPVSPEELRVAIQTMFKELSNNNVAAVEWFKIPENQDLALSTMLPGSVMPDEAQRLKTEADIQTIIDKGLQPILNQQTGAVQMQLPVQPSKRENFPIAKEVLERYLLDNFQLRTEDPPAWQGLHQLGDMYDDMDMQVGQEHAARQQKVQAAGQPPPQQPDPQVAAMQQQLEALSMQMTGVLGRIAAIDPALTGGAKDQISAAKEILDTTVDAAKLLQGGK